MLQTLFGVVTGRLGRKRAVPKWNAKAALIARFE